MNRQSRALWTSIFVTIFLCLAGALSAGAAGPSIAKIEIQQDLILWNPLVSSGMELTISGPGGNFRQEFAAGDFPSFSLVDDAGETLAAGTYAWELTLIQELPSHVVEQLKAAREAGEVIDVSSYLPNREVHQSGYFTVAGGGFALPIEESIDGKSAGVGFSTEGGSSELQTRDQVIADDLIVQFSACIGNDCNNGESFGFDTLRLKENNLRIKFQDTSTSASFPTNDWQITANDSSNGGANKFSIDDIDGGRTPFTIEATAPSNSLYVDAAGDVGFGTATPVVELHVKDGDTPTLRLEQDGSSGFTAQTWDVAGNEAGFFVRDVTNGSALPFRITTGAPSDFFVIAGGSTDSVGIGAGTSPDATLHVKRTNGTSQIHVEDSGSPSTNFPMLKLENTNGTTQIVQFEMSNNAAIWRFDNGAGGAFSLNKGGTGGTEIEIRDRNDSTGAATLTVNGSVQATNLAFSSSREWKTDFNPLDPVDVLDRVSGLEMTSWRFKDDGSGVRHIGPIAEEFSAAFPLGGDGKHVSAIDIGGVALTAIQGLNQRVQELEAEKAALSSTLEELRALIESMAQTQ